MTPEWMERLYEKAGQDMWDAMTANLLREFRYLGEQRLNPTNPDTTQPRQHDTPDA